VFLLYLTLVAVLLVAEAAGVRKVADIGAYAYYAAYGFYGEHQAGVCELNAAGILFGEKAEKCGLGRYVPAAIAGAEAVGALES